MKRFKYKAKDKSGKLVMGEVEAMTEQEAANLVKKQGFIVLSLSPAGNIFSFITGFRDRISPADVATFTRQLATMVNAGLPITEALIILRNQYKGIMQKTVAEILGDVEGGQALSAALSKHPKAFNQTYVALIKSGEVGGVLDKVLLRLADNLEKQQEFKGKVQGALIYPVIIIVGMVVVGLGMTIFVVPRLTSLYDEFGAQLPLPTKILVGVSNVLITYWPLLLLAVGAGIYGFTLYRKTPAGRKKIDELIFKIPVLGELQKEIILAELTRTLSLMVGAGVSILEGLQITANAVGNVIIADALREAAKDVEKGFPIAFSFAKHPEAFPYILSQMISVGEETGKMDDVLEKISHIFEVESDQKVKTLTTAIEPIIMVFLGVGVAFLVIAVILPIYNLTSQFQ